MRVVVDLEQVVAVIADVDDLSQASVVVVSPPNATADSDATVHRLADVLAATNVGTLQPDGTARLRADALRFHAAGQVDEDWERRFAALCENDGDGPLVAAPAKVTWPLPS